MPSSQGIRHFIGRLSGFLYFIQRTVLLFCFFASSSVYAQQACMGIGTANTPVSGLCVTPTFGQEFYTIGVPGRPEITNISGTRFATLQAALSSIDSEQQSAENCSYSTQLDDSSTPIGIKHDDGGIGDGADGYEAQLYLYRVTKSYAYYDNGRQCSSEFTQVYPINRYRSYACPIEYPFKNRLYYGGGILVFSPAPGKDFCFTDQQPCPIAPLTSLAELSQQANEIPEEAANTQALENRADGYSLLSQATQQAEQCLAGRIGAGYSGPTSTVRTVAYQKHLREVWSKFFKLQEEVADNPSSRQACQQVIASVEAEMGLRLSKDPKRDACNVVGRAHCLRHQPAAGEDGRHTKNIAFDISRETVAVFAARIRRQTPPRTVQQEANTCGLDWGGVFFNDPVHFQLR